MPRGARFPTVTPASDESHARFWLAAIRTALPVLVWALFAAWMVGDWRRDPYNPALTGTSAYGHNGEGALGFWLGASAVELSIALAATCPFLTRRPRWFFVVPLLSGGPFALWFMLCAVMSMHGGGIDFIHLFWLMALGLWLLVETALSAATGLATAR